MRQHEVDTNRQEVEVLDDDGDYLYTRDILVPMVFEDTGDEDHADIFISDPSGLPISFPFARRSHPFGFQRPSERL